jgi:hyperosmotically inducible protein
MQHTTLQTDRSFTMIIRNTLAATFAAIALLSATGCAVSRGQQTTGAYIDDATITSQVKSRMLDSPDVAGTSISVETLNGTVMLSGFSKSATEKSSAERIARDVNGVKMVKNEIAVRP